MDNGSFFTKEVKVMLLILGLIGAGVGFGVRYGLLPERVDSLENVVEKDHKSFRLDLNGLNKKTDYLVCKDTPDPQVRRILDINCDVPAVKRQESLEASR